MFLFDLPSVLGVLFGLFMGDDSKHHRWKSILNISLILGACLSLIGIIRMLSQVDGSVFIGQHIAMALLPMLYSAIVAGLCSIFSSMINSMEQEDSPTPFIHKAYSVALFAIVLLLDSVYDGSVIIFWDITAFGLMSIFSGVPVVILWYSRYVQKQEKLAPSLHVDWHEIRYYTVLGMGVICGLSLICTLYYVDNPTAIGPWMAVGLLSQLYGCSILGVVSIMDTHKEKNIHYTVLIGIAIALLEIFLSISVLFFLM